MSIAQCTFYVMMHFSSMYRFHFSAKQEYELVEYSLSQSTLEQVKIYSFLCNFNRNKIPIHSDWNCFLRR